MGWQLRLDEAAACEIERGILRRGQGELPEWPPHSSVR